MTAIKRPTISRHRLVRNMIPSAPVQRGGGKCPVCKLGFPTPGRAISHAASVCGDSKALTLYQLLIDNPNGAKGIFTMCRINSLAGRFKG